nr:MAG TPA: SH3 domain protein [Caudoviricetes sp.]
MAFAESSLIKRPVRKRSAFSEQASLIIERRSLYQDSKELQYKIFINSRAYGEATKTKKEGFLSKVLNVIKSIFEAIAKAFGNFWNWLRKLFKSKKLTQAEEKISKLEKEIADLKGEINKVRERGLNSVRKVSEEKNKLKSELASTKENAKNREEKMNEVIVNLQKRVDDKQAYIERLQKQLDANKGGTNNNQPKTSVNSKPVVKEDRSDNPRLKEWIKSLRTVATRCKDTSGYIIKFLYSTKEDLMKVPEEGVKKIGTYYLNGEKSADKSYLDNANEEFQKFVDMSENIISDIEEGIIYLGKDDAKEIWEIFKTIKNDTFIKVNDITKLTLQTITDTDPAFAKQVNLIVESTNQLHGNVQRIVKESAKILTKLFQTNNIEPGAVKVLQKYL